MRLRVITRWQPRHSLRQAVRTAITNFCNAPALGCRGHYPAEARFNPAQLPPYLELEGLAVLPDESVPPGNIAVSTADVLSDGELAAERRRFGALVRAETRRVYYQTGVTSENQF
jgi:hypothetical protein